MISYNFYGLSEKLIMNNTESLAMDKPPMAVIRYGVAVETDSGSAYVAIEKEIEKLLDRNNVAEAVDDICKRNGASGAKVTIQIFSHA